MISKNTPHLSNIRDLKKNTPHLSNIRDLKKKKPYTCQTSAISKITPHLTNIRDLKKYPTPNKHPRSTVKKNTPHLTNIRDLKLFSREKFTRKNGKIREKFTRKNVKKIRDTVKKYPTPNKHPRSTVKKNTPHLTNIRDPRAVHLSKGVPEPPFTYTTNSLHAVDYDSVQIEWRRPCPVLHSFAAQASLCLFPILTQWIFKFCWP